MSKKRTVAELTDQAFYLAAEITDLQAEVERVKEKICTYVQNNTGLRNDNSELREENKRLKEILDKFVCQENYCGSDGREVELIVPIEVYDEACEIALKENEK